MSEAETSQEAKARTNRHHTTAAHPIPGEPCQAHLAQLRNGKAHTDEQDGKDEIHGGSVGGG